MTKLLNANNDLQNKTISKSRFSPTHQQRLKNPFAFFFFFEKRMRKSYLVSTATFRNVQNYHVKAA